MILATVLLLASVTIRPASPTIGDPVTLEFPAPVTLEASRDYEVVSREGNRVVVRTFTPKPFEVRGTMNGAPVRVRVPIRSVLQANDPLTPAPLAPPRPMPYPRAPFWIIGAAALFAAGAWLFAYVRSRRKVQQPAVPMQSAEERFRAAVLALQQQRSWGRLADVTRSYLAATRPDLRSDLTTSELVPRLTEHERFVAHILRQGDLEKFSTRGADAVDFDEHARRALELAS